MEEIALGDVADVPKGEIVERRAQVVRHRSADIQGEIAKIATVLWIGNIAHGLVVDEQVETLAIGHNPQTVSGARTGVNLPGGNPFRYFSRAFILLV